MCRKYIRLDTWKNHYVYLMPGRIYRRKIGKHRYIYVRGPIVRCSPMGQRGVISGNCNFSNDTDDECCFCGSKRYIHKHHENNELKYFIYFMCASCHRRYHNGWFDKE